MSAQRFIGQHKDDKRDITVERLSASTYRVTLGDDVREVDARQFEGGAWSLLIDGQSYDVELEVAGENESEGAYNALVRGGVVSLNVQDERRSRMGVGSSAMAVDGPQVVVAPMPGKVVKILVEEGAEVSSGDPIIVVEAMKMENELRAPADGSVQKIHVTEGQAVEARAKLISLE